MSRPKVAHSHSHAPCDPQRDLAWIKGTGSSKANPSTMAALSFNRFNDRRIIVSPTIAHFSVGSVSGSLNDPYRFVNQIVAASRGEIRKEVRGKFIYIMEK